MVRAAAPPELHPIAALPQGFSVSSIFGYAALISALFSSKIWEGPDGCLPILFALRDLVEFKLRSSNG